MALPRVLLETLNEAEYAAFARLQVIEYADQLARAGEVTREQSRDAALEALADLLADRLRTRGHEFFAATADGTPLGWLWVSPAPNFLGSGHERTRWLSQLTVREDQRRRGWGRAMLLELEQRLARSGVQQLWLRVFDWNVAARRLYASLGYEVVTRFAVDAHLRKRLSREEPRGDGE